MRRTDRGCAARACVHFYTSKLSFPVQIKIAIDLVYQQKRIRAVKNVKRKLGSCQSLVLSRDS